jgi:hypothetical protein
MSLKNLIDEIKELEDTRKELKKRLLECLVILPIPDNELKQIYKDMLNKDNFNNPMTKSTDLIVYFNKILNKIYDMCGDIEKPKSNIDKKIDVDYLHEYVNHYILYQLEHLYSPNLTEEKKNRYCKMIIEQIPQTFTTEHIKKLLDEHKLYEDKNGNIF